MISFGNGHMKKRKFARYMIHSIQRKAFSSFNWL